MFPDHEHQPDRATTAEADGSDQRAPGRPGGRLRPRRDRRLAVTSSGLQRATCAWVACLGNAPTSSEAGCLSTSNAGQHLWW